MKSIIKVFFPLLFIAIVQSSCANTRNAATEQQQQTNQEQTRILFETSKGNIIVKLYDETPLHRDNFIRLVTEGFYDGVLFHRVIPNFMIQTGDPDSRNAQPGQHLGTGGPGYTIPAEFIFPQLFHKRGALAAARIGDHINPLRESSGSQFYIVTGTTFEDFQLDNIEAQRRAGRQNALFQQKAQAHMEVVRRYQAENNTEGLYQLQNIILAEIEQVMANEPEFRFTEAQREIYRTIGGTPFLDNEYTVFGQIVEGMEVVDKISATTTGAGDRPTEDIKIIRASVIGN